MQQEDAVSSDMSGWGVFGNYDSLPTLVYPMPNGGYIHYELKKVMLVYKKPTNDGFLMDPNIYSILSGNWVRTEI